MDKNIKFTAEENSFILEAEGKKLRVSYAEFTGNHAEAMKFCKDNGGGDETVENLRLLAKCREFINEELGLLGKKPLGGWYWIYEMCWHNDAYAFVVSMYSGDVSYGHRYYDYHVRAVSALN